MPEWLGDACLFNSLQSADIHGNIGMKFNSKLTFEDHECGIVSLVSQRIGILM